MSDLNWDYSSQIACALKALRVARGLTQEELATLLSDELLVRTRRWNKTINADYIKRIENCEEELTLKRLSLISHLLHCKLSKVILMAEELVDFECKSVEEQRRLIIEIIDDTLDGPG